MARIFLSITIILIVISAALSIQTKKKIAGERETAEHADSQLKASMAAQDKLVADAKKAKLEAEKAARSKAEAESAAEAASKEAKLIADQLQAAKDAVAAKDSKIKDLETKIAEVPAPAPAPAVDPAQAAAVEDMKRNLDEQKTIAATLQSKASAAEAKAKALQEEREVRRMSSLKVGLEGKVLAVNPGWNFVVLNIGGHEGVVTNATLLVKRGGSMVARLKISSVDQQTSVADIIPGSFLKGSDNFVRPGDIVIYSGS